MADAYKSFNGEEEEEVDEEHLSLRAVLLRASAAFTFVGAIIFVRNFHGSGSASAKGFEEVVVWCQQFIVALVEYANSSVVYTFVALVLLLLFFVNIYFIQKEKVHLKTR